MEHAEIVSSFAADIAKVSDWQFVGLLKSITLKGGERTFSISTEAYEPIRGLVREITGNAYDVYSVKIYLPIEIYAGQVKDHEEIFFDAKLEEVKVKDSPTIRGTLPREAVQELNEHLLHWEREVVFGFTRKQIRMEFGDDLPEEAKPKKSKNNKNS